MMCARHIQVRILAVWGCALLLAACAPASGQTSAPNSETQVLDHLNQIVRWSRLWDSTYANRAHPGDELYVENGREIARQVVKLEFQSALAQAALIKAISPTAAQPNGVAQSQSDNQNLIRYRQRIGQQVQSLQTRLDAVNRRLPVARPKDWQALMTERDTLQGQLQLAQDLQGNLEKLTSLMTSTESASGAASELTAKILALQRTILGVVVTPANGKAEEKATSPAPAPMIGEPQDRGLIGQMGQMIQLMQSLRALHQMKDETVELRASTKLLRAPLLAALRSTLQQGQIVLFGPGTDDSQSGSNVSTPTTVQTPAAAPPSTAANPGTVPPAVEQHTMAELVQRFKLLSSATLPLSQELVLMDRSQANLAQLQASIQQNYTSILRMLLLKVATILVLLGLIWLLSELWRRASFRYIRDPRRRRQFLLLRRSVIGFCMAVVILLGFISDFSSLATYAGLITAGVAVALQAVILSVAAYFFLVGRYGVKVGDRITVVYNGPNSVAGDVVDIGLVRFYMMELAGNGIDMQPTGRICVFPNSVLFQTNPLFKQLPGTEYAWREIALPLRAESDGQLAERELMAVVERLYSEYRPALEKQQQLSIETTMGVHVETPKPYARTRFAENGLRIIVRYPVPLHQAGAIDDRIVMEVTDLLRKNPSIQLVPGASPELQSPVRV